jgi:hypothetical protein
MEALVLLTLVQNKLERLSLTSFLLAQSLGVEQKNRGQFVEQNPMLSSSLGVTKFTIAKDMIFVHFVVLLNSDLNVQQTHLGP